MNRTLPVYDVHPVSAKMLRKGHPWVIKDKFTERFHPRDRFIVAKDKRRPFALLIHDPRHDRVKARLWSAKGDFAGQIRNFRKDLSQRIQAAVNKRAQKGIKKRRQNYYLVFGEADRLPGVHVQVFGSELLIQFYSFFWEHYEDLFIEQILKAAASQIDEDISKANIWTQRRAKDANSQEKAVSLDPNCSFRKVEVEEFGVKYLVELGKRYDCGLYTDMASVRSFLRSDFQQAKSVLNLYSYTGAFSLFALKNRADQVVSVDLSREYLDILEKNIELNEDLDSSKHACMDMSAKEALNRLISEQAGFDLIISDPPSASSDGSKRSNALQDYEKELPKMAKLLAEGGKICVFLNTKKIGRAKFEKKILDIVDKNSLGLKVEKRLGLAEDCPALKGFPEGSYLKGLALVHD